MAEIGVHRAKTDFSKLLRRVMSGEEIVITRGGDPVAKLVPIRGKKTRILGTDIGVFDLPDDFDEPLPDDVLAAFEN
jgi:prevent-host-death family protein